MAPAVEEVDSEEGEEDGVAEEPQQSFADLLGPQCTIKRVDKDRNVVGTANADEMERELRTRAVAQKRIGACAEHVKNMSRTEKLRWALDVKEKANELYAASSFEEASRLYSDCLVALDLDGSPEENKDVATKLQLPVCTNLAACMIESGRYARCVEICDIALGVDPDCAKALYRRGLARYRMGDHAAARPDFESALHSVRTSREAAEGGGAGDEGHEEKEEAAEQGAPSDLERRVLVYLGHIRRHCEQEKQACQKMFDRPLYSDRPDPREPAVDPAEVDDSDEAIDAALARIRGDWLPRPSSWARCCRRRTPLWEGRPKTS